MWNKKATVKFWKKCTADLSGDRFASEIIKLARKYIGETVIDVGAGAGELIDRIPNAIGLDIVSRHKKIVEGDVTKMPFKDGTFDTVFAIELLEHLDDDALGQSLVELERVLRKGGYLIVTTPYKEDFRNNMVSCPNCDAEFHRWGHQQVFDEKRMAKMLEENGFSIIKVRILPLGLMVRHKFVKHFRAALIKFKLIESTPNLFIVAKKQMKCHRGK